MSYPVAAARGKSSGTVLSTLASGLFISLNLSEASGTRLDSSGRGNNFTPTGSPGNAPAIVGNGLQITGDGKYLSIASNADLLVDNTVSWTASLWFKPSSIIQKMIAAKGSHWPTASGFCWELYTLSTGVPVFDVSDGAARASLSPNSITFATGIWYHLIWGYDAANQQLFFKANGRQTTYQSYTGAIADSASFSLYVGGSEFVPTGGGVPGIYDSFQFYRRRLGDDI